MEASQFTRLSSSLETVDLTSNVCIDEKFVGKAEIQRMISEIESAAIVAQVLSVFITWQDVAYVTTSTCSSHRPKNNELFCEQIARCEFGICCDIGRDTSIDYEDYRIVTTEYPRIQSLEIRDYKKYETLENIHFLPLANSLTRNLIQYKVVETSLKAITKENFNGMIWLERLVLLSNSIETIQRDTFQGLVRLNKIDLSKRNFT